VRASGTAQGATSTALTYDVVQAPIGRLIVASDGTAIAGVWMANASPDDEHWADQRGGCRSD
jgi:hypothetical protein